METLEVLQRRLTTARELGALVHTMKALSAVSIRLYQQALLALEESRSTVELGLRVALTRDPALLEALAARPGPRPPHAPAPRRDVVVLLGADRGMCGPFNERVVSQAVAFLEEANRPAPLILAVGHRLERPCEAAALAIAARETMPASPRGITPVAEAILLHYDEWRARGEAEGLVLVHNRPTVPTGYVAHAGRLFPVHARWLRRIAHQPWPTRNIPMSPNPAAELYPGLIRRHLLLMVHQALAQSLASEHTGRLIAMQQAERNVEEHRSRLEAEYHRRRQQVVDEELLDLVSGYRALAETDADSG